MSWQVTLIENTVTFPETKQYEVSQSVQKNLRDIDKWVFEDGSCGVSKGSLLFQEDHMEHMDWLSLYIPVVEVLVAHGASGRVCFGSLDGDNTGSFWGYDFRPGECIRLVGNIIWMEQ